MYKESWGLKRICPMCSKQYYDLGREELVCPECGKEIEVTTMSRPRRGRKPGSTNAAPLVNPVPPKPKEKEDELDIENIDLDNSEDNLDDDTVLLEDETGEMSLNWFNQPWIAKKLHPEMKIRVFGALSIHKDKVQMNNPRWGNHIVHVQVY